MDVNASVTLCPLPPQKQPPVLGGPQGVWMGRTEKSFLSPITLDNKLKKIVSVMNMLLICLFASMNLEKGQKVTWL
jgi:hypothetical protein